MVQDEYLSFRLEELNDAVQVAGIYGQTCPLASKNIEVYKQQNSFNSARARTGTHRIAVKYFRVMHSYSTCICIQVPRFSFRKKKISGLEWGSTHTLTSLVWCSTSWATKPLGGSWKKGIQVLIPTQVLRFSFPGRKKILGLIFKYYRNALLMS